MDYKKSAARKYLVGVHSKGLIIDPKTNKPTITYIKARPSCKRCYGRGFVGWYNEGGGQIKVWMCVCFVRKNFAYIEDHGLSLEEIKIELMVDDEESNSKIKVVGGLNAVGILGDTGHTARV